MQKRILIAASMVAFAATVFVASAARSAAPEEKRIVVIRGDAAPPTPGAAERFTGKAFINARFEGTRPSHLAASLVSFTPGAHTAWHSHPHGQMLVVTSGCGWVQQEGGERQEIRASDIVWTPPGVKHWHGAGTQGPMTHAAVQERLDAQEVTWLQKVSAKEYGDGACKDRVPE